MKKWYVRNENNWYEILEFDTYKEAVAWCETNTKWTEGQIKARIKEDKEKA